MKQIMIGMLFLAIFVLPCTAQDTLQVFAGWNIVGSLANGPVSSILGTLPPGIIQSSFYGYTPGGGYGNTDTLTRGKGYWVKVSADGVIIFGGGGGWAPCADAVEYEGGPYPTVGIGSQCWLTKNMNLGTMISGGSNQTDNATLEKYCYDDDTSNCTQYGGLYQWNEAMQYSVTEGDQGICPPGWHIPTKAEFDTLSAAVGGSSNALKALGQGTGGGAGTNTSGFSALLGGYKTDEFGSLGLGTAFYTSTRVFVFPSFSHYWEMNGVDDVIFASVAEQWKSLSVRCLMD